MNTDHTGRIALALAFASGLLAVAWVGTGFVGSNPVALAMSVLIGAAYLAGAAEIARFRSATRTLAATLAATTEPPAALEAWLTGVHATLRPAVRLRIEGERVALPGLALTPYLVGLLVMLGMLGTFIGMVATFRGTVSALEGSTDLAAVRTALAEPIRGLGLAFGTSVAGVAASAMLGLMSVLARRERLAAARMLDECVPVQLRAFNLGWQRLETWRALQAQGSALPRLAEQLGALAGAIEQRGEALDAGLLERHGQFQQALGEHHARLADTLHATLAASLEATARAASEAIATAVGTASQAIAASTARAADALQARVITAGTALDGALAQAGTLLQSGVASAMTGMVTESRETHARLAHTVQEQVAVLLGGVEATATRVSAEHAAAEQRRHAAWSEALQATAATLQDACARAGEQTLAAQQAGAAALAQAVATLTSSSVEQVARVQEELARLLDRSEELVDARAASESRWQEQFAARDAAALQERAALVHNINTLLQSVAQATGEQRAAIESLVGSASAVLTGLGEQFTAALETQTTRAESAAAQVAGSAIELASLGEAFQQGVGVFGATQERLIESLQRVEEALARSLARSDEQLAYYVAQAREVIDLSISAQQGVLEDLRRLRALPDAPPVRTPAASADPRPEPQDEALA
jgi:hypothetical protein